MQGRRGARSRHGEALRRASVAALVLFGAPLAFPVSAAAHGGGGSAAHRATDLAGVRVTTLERQARAKARRLGRRPGTRSSASAAAVLDPGAGGRWSGILPAPVIPIFEALLPNGKVLMWDSVGDNPTESYSDHTFTRAAVYDPTTNTSRRVDVAGANLFCAGFVQLANGNVFVAGGNASAALDGIRRTHVFDWRTETWSRGPDMQDGRWYPSVAASPTDEAVIVGGGPTVAEVRTSSGGLRRLTGVTTASDRDYPFLHTAPDGRALLMGPSAPMSLIDPFGTGSIAGAGPRDGIHRGYGSYAPFDVGRFLVAGGGSVTEDGRSGVPTRTATTVDTRSGAPVARAAGSMALRRRQANLTSLADGSLLATGGQSTNGGGGLVDLANAVYAAERWDPATGAWTELNAARVARQYHSTALLLPDGQVLTGGGGICGVCRQVGYLRKDMEVYAPPYLFRRDGSGQLATRPRIAGAPAQITYDAPFSVSSPDAAQIRKMALIRLGAPTHGQDQGQRYVPVGFSASGSTLTVNGPANPNEAPAGYYMLFAIDAAGVPSVAAVIQVQRTVAPAAPAAVNLARDRSATSSAACSANEGPAKAVNGSVSGGPSDKWCSPASSRWLQVDLGSTQTISSFTVRHAGAGGEPTSLNTRDFRLESSTSGWSWRTASTVSGNTANDTTRTFSSRSARYVRLVVTAGEQSRSGLARIYELEVYGTATAQAPAAIPAVAYSGQNATGRVQRFEVGQYDLGRGNLGQIGGDAMRSLDVGSGYRATICQHPQLVSCTTLPAGRYATMPAGYDATMSSLRVSRGP